MNRREMKFTDSAPIPAYHRISVSAPNKFGGSTTITFTMAPDQKLDESARDRVRKILLETLEKLPV